MKLYWRILILLILLTSFISIIIYLPAPITWQQASDLQILGIFIPLLLVATFFAYIFLNSITHSFIFGLGIVAIGLLQALNKLTLVSSLAIIITTWIGIRYFPKIRLTRRLKIPKLTRMRS